MQIGGALNRAGGPNIAFNPATTGFDPSSGSLALTATGGIFKNSSLVLRALSSVGRSTRSEEHTSELQSLMRISYAVFCLKKKNEQQNRTPSLILSSE